MDYWELPLGFAMALAENRSAFDRFQGLDTAAREQVISRARGAKSEEEMKQIVYEI